MRVVNGSALSVDGSPIANIWISWISKAMGLLLKNNARSTLSASITAMDTTIRVRVGHGVRFPQPSATGDWFPLTLEDQSGRIEILRATARQGDMITVTRGAEGTQARSFVSGDAVELRATAAVFANSSGGGGDDEIIAVSISDAQLG